MGDASDHSQDGGWGWEALGSEDDAEGGGQQPAVSSPGRPDGKIASSISKSMSEKSLVTKRGMIALPGITSSPSFQELEKAIGATLAMSLSTGDMSEMGGDGKAHSPSGTMLNQRLSSTNLTQQKLIQQRMRQQFHQSHRSPNYASAYKQPFMPAMSHLSTKAELAPFLNESESRALIILHSPFAPQAAVKEACSKFGVLYYIRPEFHAKGVTFISYFDLQAATAAKAGIPDLLGAQAEASAHFSIMLHATNSNTEEFRLVVKNLPKGDQEAEVQSIFARYGPLRSISKTFASAADLQAAPAKLATAYSVEYFNIQDARLAASELSATSATLWGPDTSVKFAPLDERKQQLCQQLLATLSRWRSDMANNNSLTLPPPLGMAAPMQFSGFSQMMPPPLSLHAMQMMSGYSFPVSNGGFGGNFINMEMPPIAYGQSGFMPPPMPRGGYYQYPPPLAAMDSPSFAQQQPAAGYAEGDFVSNTSNSSEGFRHQAEARADNSRSHYANPSSSPQGQPQHGRGTHTAIAGFPAEPYGVSAMRGKPSGVHSSSAYQMTSNGSHDADFSLDLARICAGTEARTTVMVRNIPNKYNQQMLLEEVNNRHQGTYDFFYLPIDFKNRCNVGYCFVNFLDPKYIVPFVEEFNGQRWRSFNSEKVCAVSFARIQGRSAMVARFQNSSLLDKDEEYKPLLFYSSGQDKGKPEPFPASTRQRNLPTEHGFGQADGTG